MKTKWIIACGLIVSAGRLLKAQQNSDSLTRNIQVTFITPLGTNGLDAYKYTNRFSFNIFAGVSGGTRGLEVGGFANVDNGNVWGLQGAGFLNVVRNNVEGAQGAGFLNANGGDLRGISCAGFANFNKGDVTGAQLSGFCNTALGKLKGAQLSGFANFNCDSLTGLQGAGYANVNLGSVHGVQASGFLNFAKGDVKGAQLSGFVNIARKVKGLQLGFINIADSVDGAAIGYLSIIRKGLHRAEFSSDELFRANAAFISGNHLFHNIFSAGFSPSGNKMLWQLGYGCGTSFYAAPKWRAELSLSMHHVSRGLLYHGTSELYRFYAGMEWKLADKIHLAAGPTFNLYLGDALLPDYNGSYKNIAPYALLDETSTYGFNYKAWVGFKAAIRFF